MAEQRPRPRARASRAVRTVRTEPVPGAARRFLWSVLPASPLEGWSQTTVRDHFKRLQSSVRRAFCISSQGQAAFKLRLTAVEGRDVIAATDISKGSVIICPLLYDCVLDRIPSQLLQFMDLLSTMESSAALIRTIYNGIQKPMSDLMKRSCERVEVECVKRGATRAQRRLIRPVISLLANMSYANWPLWNVICGTTCTHVY